MGVDIKALLVREKTNLESFSSKIIAIDAYNEIGRASCRERV